MFAGLWFRWKARFWRYGLLVICLADYFRGTNCIFSVRHLICTMKVNITLITFALISLPLEEIIISLKVIGRVFLLISVILICNVGSKGGFRYLKFYWNCIFENHLLVLNFFMIMDIVLLVFPAINQRLKHLIETAIDKFYTVKVFSYFDHYMSCLFES